MALPYLFGTPGCKNRKLDLCECAYFTGLGRLTVETTPTFQWLNTEFNVISCLCRSPMWNGRSSVPQGHSGTQGLSYLWLCSSLGPWSSLSIHPGKWVMMKTHLLFTMWPYGNAHITSVHILWVRNSHMAPSRCKGSWGMGLPVSPENG